MEKFSIVQVPVLCLGLGRLRFFKGRQLPIYEFFWALGFLYSCTYLYTLRFLQQCNSAGLHRNMRVAFFRTRAYCSKMIGNMTHCVSLCLQATGDDRRQLNLAYCSILRLLNWGLCCCILITAKFSSYCSYYKAKSRFIHHKQNVQFFSKIIGFIGKSHQLIYYIYSTTNVHIRGRRDSWPAKI